MPFSYVLQHSQSDIAISSKHPLSFRIGRRGSKSSENRELLEPVEDNSRRGHSFKLMKHHTNKSVRSHFFSERVINNWNSLPEDVVAAQSINAFKNRLDWHWKDKQYLIR